MLRILSYILTFMAGGIMTLIFHCMVIVAKEADEKKINYINKNIKEKGQS